MKKVLLALLLLCSSNVMATLLTEDFEGTFPEWESNWLGINSNLQNHYGVGMGRGNNPDGLWINDGDNTNSSDVVEIVFDYSFGVTLSTFSIDIAPHIDGVSIQIFDISGLSIFNSAVVKTNGATQSPGIYNNFFVTSTNGISGFSLFSTGSSIEGNTGIDNVSVTTGNVSVPEPSTLAVFALGIMGLASRRFKKQS